MDYLFLPGAVSSENFLLSLADHAQNGFFYLNEWIPVASSALAIGFLFTVIIRSVNHFFLKQCLWIIGIQIIVGLLGFYFHLVADLRGPASSFMDNLKYGAPVFAPLLLPNLAILATIGLWDILDKTFELQMKEQTASLLANKIWSKTKSIGTFFKKSRHVSLKKSNPY